MGCFYIKKSPITGALGRAVGCMFPVPGAWVNVSSCFMTRKIYVPALACRMYKLTCFCYTAKYEKGESFQAKSQVQARW